MKTVVLTNADVDAASDDVDIGVVELFVFELVNVGTYLAREFVASKVSNTSADEQVLASCDTMTTANKPCLRKKYYTLT